MHVHRMCTTCVPHVRRMCAACASHVPCIYTACARRVHRRRGRELALKETMLLWHERAKLAKQAKWRQARSAHVHHAHTHMLYTSRDCTLYVPCMHTLVEYVTEYNRWPMHVRCRCVRRTSGRTRAAVTSPRSGCLARRSSYTYDRLHLCCTAWWFCSAEHKDTAYTQPGC